MIEPPDATLLMALRVAPRGAPAAPIRSLQFLPGCAAGSSGSGGPGGGSGEAPAEDCLLVFGGQGAGEPDMLTLLPLVPQPGAGQEGGGGSGGAEGRQVPWFGSIKAVCTVSWAELSVTTAVPRAPVLPAASSRVRKSFRP